MERTKIYAERRDYARKVAIIAVRGNTLGQVSWVQYDESLEYEPTLSLHREDGQALMDALWDCGLRPTEGSGSAGALAATERHLKDLQRLVFEYKVDVKA